MWAGTAGTGTVARAGAMRRRGHGNSYFDTDKPKWRTESPAQSRRAVHLDDTAWTADTRLSETMDKPREGIGVKKMISDLDLLWAV